MTPHGDSYFCSTVERIRGRFSKWRLLPRFKLFPSVKKAERSLQADTQNSVSEKSHETNDFRKRFLRSALNEKNRKSPEVMTERSHVTQMRWGRQLHVSRCLPNLPAVGWPPCFLLSILPRFREAKHRGSSRLQTMHFHVGFQHWVLSVSICSCFMQV